MQICITPTDDDLCYEFAAENENEAMCLGYATLIRPEIPAVIRMLRDWGVQMRFVLGRAVS